MAENADLARYKPVFDRMRAMKPYQLSDELEKFLHDQSVVGRAPGTAVRRNHRGAELRRRRRDAGIEAR
jgi:oligoendopeptidase F